MAFKIYVVTNKNNGKKYVGQTCQTIEKRWIAHCSAARTGDDNYFYRAIRKYGEDSFHIEIIEDNLTGDEANEAEGRWIIKLNSIDSNKGYNGTYGGYGSRPTELTKQKVSKTRKLLYQNPEFKRRMSKANIGKHHSKSGRSNIAKALIGNQYRRGIPHSQEVKDKISKTLKAGYAAGIHHKTGGLKKGTKLGPMSKEQKLRIAETMRRVRQERKWSTKKKEIRPAIDKQLAKDNLTLPRVSGHC